MTHFLAMLQKRAGDIDDSSKHHSNHGQYQDERLPHRSDDNSEGRDDL